MLKEEAHHMIVGTTGVDRVVERTAQVMVENDTDDVAALGAIRLPVIQKYLNFHYAVSLDLFGSETSTNVANYYTAGIKGRWLEDRRRDDHQLTDDWIMVDALTPEGEIGADRGLRANRAEHRPAPGVHQPTARAASSAGTGSWNRPGWRSGSSSRTSRSTARSARSPASRPAPTASSSPRTNGSGARASGCPPIPTRPTSAR